jgi:NADPH2:quinone reductase
MKAVLCKSLDGPESLVLEDIAEPTAGPGEVVIKVTAAALNFFDTLVTRGKYQKKPPLPFSPSGEVAGVVDSLGAGVTGLARGQRVAAYVSWGGAREKVVVPAEAVIPVPDNVSDVIAAGVSVTYGTAIHGLKDRGRVNSNEWVAVTGASGGAGLAAIEIAKQLGARVIAVASSAEKLEICRAHGADVLVNYSEGDLKEMLKAVTNGDGVDVVYDCVGGAYAEPAVRALAWGGRFLVVGFATGTIPKLPLNLLLVKGADAVGVFWGESVRRDPLGHRDNMTAVLNWVSEGKLVPHIHATYPLAQAAQAIAVLDRREAVGKVVLTV